MGLLSMISLEVSGPNFFSQIWFQVFRCFFQGENQRKRNQVRPLSVPFLIRTSGKGTDTATTLELEKSRRIDFSLGRWPTRGKKTPKSMTPYVKVPGELVRIFFHSLLWPQRSLLYGLPPNCTKQSVFLTLQLDRICQKIEFHICQQCSFSGSTLP